MDGEIRNFEGINNEGEVREKIAIYQGKRQEKVRRKIIEEDDLGIV